MDDPGLSIDRDLARASTMPAEFYRDASWFERAREKVFARSWQGIGDRDAVKVEGQVCPVTWLDGLVDEPLLLTRDARGEVHGLSNVCTHRGNLVAEQPQIARGLRCRYHGRRFGLDGRFESMPEFEGVVGFPTAADDLRRVPIGALGRFLFAAIDPRCAYDEWIAAVRARVGWLPLDEFVLDPRRARDYLVRAHWALYVDNYLEGFHIPYIHAALAQTLDYENYRTELQEWSSLQLAIAKPGELAFELPKSSPDFGQRVAAYYFWLYPNTMLNFYPWGLSINLVKPLRPDLTRVTFVGYVWRPELAEQGAGAGLDRVEREDESIVESVQRGVSSRLYRSGRYSVRREACVHHFHRLLAAHLGG